MIGKRTIFSYILFTIFLLNIISLAIALDVSEDSPREKNTNPNFNSHFTVPPPQRDILGAVIRGRDSQAVTWSDPSTPPFPFKHGVQVPSGYSNPSWGNSRWRFRKNITIDHNQVNANLNNFPVLIDLYDPDLRHALTSGEDIMFTDASGTQLEHEIELFEKYYNTSHTHLTAWVKTNLSSAVDTVISMYFSNPFAGNQANPTAVWDSNYQAVWHLSDNPTGTIYDSTSNNNDGTTNNMTSTDLVSAQIGKGLELDGINDWINISDSTSLDSTNDEGTLQLWINWDNAADGTWQRVMTSSNRFAGGGGPDGFEWASQNDGDHFFYPWGGNSNNYNLGTNPFSNGIWHHLVVTLKYSTGEVKIYVDTNSMSFTIENVPTEWTSLASLNDWIWGNNPNYPNDGFAGKFDEIRVSDVVRSTDWIQTEYNNQYDVTSFYSVGAKESTEKNYVWAKQMFRYRKNITLDHTQVSADLNNFPLLLELEDADLRTYAQADGDDILFTDTTGVRLAHEIEHYTQNSTHAHLIAWVKIPTLSSGTDTIITMYYGNNAVKSQEDPEGVWTDYMGVWHLNETVTNEGSAAGVHQDSTGNGNHGNQHGNDETGGQIENAQDFDGSNDYIEMGDADTLDIDDAMGDNYYTISGWFYRDTATTTDVLVEKYDPIGVGPPADPDGTGYSLWISSSDYLYFRIADDDDDGFQMISSSTFTTPGWYHFAVTFDTGISESTWNIYINGINDTGVKQLWGVGPFTSITGFTPNNVDFTLGAHSTKIDPFDGKIDEIRMLAINKSTSWIATEYNNQLDPESFIAAVGTHEEYSNWWKFVTFAYRKDIAIDHTQLPTSGQQDLVNFPVLIVLTDDSDLRSGKVQADGDDLLFLDAEGSPLDYQLENFTQTSTEGSLRAWVSVQTLYVTEDTLLSLYYGNSSVGSLASPSDVWDSNYVGVWHLEETTGGSDAIKDATANGNNGTDVNNPILGQAGQIGNSIDFDGFDDRVQVADDSSLHIANTITVEAWINPDDFTQYQTIVSKMSGSTQHLYFGINTLAQIVVGLYPVNSSWTFPVTVSAGQWQHVAVTYDGSTINVYVDGTLEAFIAGSGSLGLSSNTNPLYFGYRQALPNRIFKGYIDELRISNNARSAYWLAVEYANQGNPTSFYSVGAEIFGDFLPPVIQDYGVHDPGKGMGYFWADITDASGVTSAYIEINTTAYAMSYNGSHWVYTLSVTFNDYYEYRILNATDMSTMRTNNQTVATSLQNYTFNYDNDPPDITDWEYFPSIGIFGTFNANVSDTWGAGGIDTVIVNVTEVNGLPAANWAYMQNTAAGYINDTLSFPRASVIKFVVIVNDTVGNSNTSVIHIGYVGDNNKPQATDLTLLPAFVRSNETVLLRYNYSDADSDIQAGTLIHWYRNGLLVPELNQTIYGPLGLTNTSKVLASYLIEGDQWYATVTPKDWKDYGTVKTSATITIQNAAPQVTSGFITPTDADTTSLLTCTYVYSDNDADLENVTQREIRWYRNGTLQPGLNDSLTVGAANTLKGDSWYFRLRVHDGDEYSLWYQSPSLQILNSPPTATGLNILDAGNLYTDDDLVANWTFNDADVGDIQAAYFIRWYRNGIYQSGLDDQLVVDSSNTARDQAWYFDLQVFDGEDNSTLFILSSSVIILNTLPVAGNLTLTLNPTTSVNLAAGWDYFDLDGDSQSTQWSIQWFKGGDHQPALDDLTTVLATYTSKGETWYYELRVHDGTDYSLVTTSPSTVIQNTAPQATSYFITPTDADTTSLLTCTYVYSDIDADLENVTQREIRWYRNGVLQPGLNDSLTVGAANTLRGDMWYFRLRVHDGDEYSLWYQSPDLEVLNSPPTATGLNIFDAGNLYTNDDLVANWTFNDADAGDSQVSYLIRWYKNGIYQAGLDDQLVVDSSNTARDQAWYFTLQVSDGTDLSIVFTSPSVQIANTIPVAENLTLTLNPRSDRDLATDWDYFDLDGDSESTLSLIRWFKNGVHQVDLDDQQTVDASYTRKDETWYYELQVFDGTDYSLVTTSPPTVIQNTPPSINNLGFVGTDPAFVVEGKVLTVSYTFDDPDLDTDQSIIYWYRDDVLQAQYTNWTSLPASALSPGDVWWVEVIPYDGEATSSTVQSTTITVESHPKIINYEIIMQNTTEGIFTLWITVTDELNKDIEGVTARIYIVGLNNNSVIRSFDPVLGRFVLENFDLLTILVNFGYTKANFTNLLQTLVLIEVTMVADVLYSDTNVEGRQVISLTIEDKAAPRVKEAGYVLNLFDQITFWASIEEYGAGIEEVVLYYRFQRVNATEGTKYQALTAYDQVVMTSNGTHYLVTISLPPSSNWINLPPEEYVILFAIKTSDRAGNINAYTETLRQGSFDRPLNLIFIIVIVGIIIAIIGVIAVVAIRRFSGTELVGLDIDRVMEAAVQVEDYTAKTSMDDHTLGVVISFFDQRHGPIPIVVEPPILKDNYNKLVELSDLSFSACRFVDNFDEELPSNFDFSLGPGIRSTSIAFGFALERPEARGGSENITLNILVHKLYASLISQFLDQFTDLVHDIHVLMDKTPEQKEAIASKVVQLRKLVSAIILSYEEMYGSVEEFEEETKK